MNRNGPLVLIVEDEPSVGFLLSRLMHAHGWRHAVVTTVAEALAALDPAPDLIVLDLMLPDADGTEVLRAVRARGLAIPVIVHTCAEPGRRAEIEALKPDAVFAKTVDLGEFEAFARGVFDAFERRKAGGE